MRELGPYAVLLIGTAILWVLAGHIESGAPGAGLGPATWPKMVIGALGLICTVEFGRRALRLRAGSAATPAFMAGDADHPAGPAGPVLCAIGASVAYLLLFEIVGFAIDSFVLVLVLMWLGRFRRLAHAVAISAVLTLILLFVFMKLVFVPLPLGVGVFSTVSLALMRLLGIH